MEHKQLRARLIARQREEGETLSDIQDMFAFISEKSQNIISSFSGEGVFTYVSPNVKALLGYTPEEVVGNPAEAFNHPDDNKRLLDCRGSEFIDRDTVRFTGRVRHKNGDYRWYETTAEYIRDRSGTIVQTIGVGRDITDRIEAEQTIAHLADHDSLTDLPNRRFFKRRAGLLLEQSKTELHGLMLLDLDGFKHINDTYGHDTGDHFLIEVASRLSRAVGDKGVAARWGGDEFTVLQSNITGKTDAASLMEKIKEALSEPILIGDNTFFVTASIGFSLFPEDGDSVETLLKRADAAMYRVKNQTKHQP